jgi:hypothetical protein
VFGAAEAKEVFSGVVQVEISALHGLRIVFFWSPSTFTIHSLDTVAEAFLDAPLSLYGATKP